MPSGGQSINRGILEMLHVSIQGCMDGYTASRRQKPQRTTSAARLEGCAGARWVPADQSAWVWPWHGTEARTEWLAPRPRAQSRQTGTQAQESSPQWSQWMDGDGWLQSDNDGHGWALNWCNRTNRARKTPIFPANNRHCGRTVGAHKGDAGGWGTNSILPSQRSQFFLALLPLGETIWVPETEQRRVLAQTRRKEKQTMGMAEQAAQCCCSHLKLSSRFEQTIRTTLDGPQPHPVSILRWHSPITA